MNPFPAMQVGDVKYTLRNPTFWTINSTFWTLYPVLYTPNCQP